MICILGINQGSRVSWLPHVHYDHKIYTGGISRDALDAHPIMIRILGIDPGSRVS